VTHLAGQVVLLYAVVDSVYASELAPLLLKHLSWPGDQHDVPASATPPNNITTQYPITSITDPIPIGIPCSLVAQSVRDRRSLCASISLWLP